MQVLQSSNQPTEQLYYHSANMSRVESHRATSDLPRLEFEKAPGACGRRPLEASHTTLTPECYADVLVHHHHHRVSHPQHGDQWIVASTVWIWYRWRRAAARHPYTPQRARFADTKSGVEWPPAVVNPSSLRRNHSTNTSPLMYLLAVDVGGSGNEPARPYEARARMCSHPSRGA